MFHHHTHTRVTASSLTFDLFITLVQKHDERLVLDVRDFQVTDVVGEKSVIVVAPKSPLPPDEDLGEDTSLLPLSRLFIKLSSLELDTTYVSDAAPPSEQLPPPPPLHPDYAVNCHRPPDEAAILPQVCDALSPSPHKEEGEVDRPQTSVKHLFLELVTNAAGDNQMMSCEVEYLRNSDVETASGRTDSSYLVCDSEYIANSCFPADKDRATHNC